MSAYRFWGSLATHSQELEVHSACRLKHKQKVVAEIETEKIKGSVVL